MVMTHSNLTERGTQMNFNRRSHIEDLLFVIALVVPAVVGGARYLEMDQDRMLIAKAHAPVMSVANTSPAPAHAVRG
jgi:hypothetical protein